MSTLTTSLVSVVAALVLTGCTPTRVDPKLPLPAVQDWQHGLAAERLTAKAALVAWWRGFRDPVLDELIAAAMAANQDLRIARARVREVRQSITVAESALYPTVEIAANGGREKSINRAFAAPGAKGIELIAPAGNAVSGGLAARWEIDVFGGRHLEAEAVTAQAAGSKEGERDVLVGLLAQVATNYLELRGVQTRTRVLEDNIALEKERLRVIRSQFKAGLTRDFDLARQETQSLATEAMLPAHQTAADTLIHRIGVLSGKPPASLQARLAPFVSLPEAAPKLPKLLPGSLLEQRPDLRLARSEVDAEAASLGAAKADLYPRLVLATSGGFGALAVGGFPSLAEGVYALGAGLSAPIFSAGRIKAGIAAADARLEQAAANYEKSFLLALEDVENAYVRHHAAVARRDELLKAEATAERSRGEANALFQRGAADLLAVLDAQQSKIKVSDERVRAETDIAVATVSLYRAFGGGWKADSADHAVAAGSCKGQSDFDETISRFWRRQECQGAAAERG
jgi:NodT family efflux transporter outer membrane factor (OMF) lipoprotein